MYLSVIIPAYNEEKNILINLEKLYSYLSNKNYEYEVILVDDGSTDNTVNLALKSTLNKLNRLILLQNESNKGKGYSVRRGILNSKGKYVLFTDADFSTPPQEIDKLFSYINRGFDIVIGSRNKPSSCILERQPFKRELFGKIFNILVRVIVIKNFSDTQCGFKLFKGDVIRKLAKYLKINGFCFDVEILYLAKKSNLKIIEVGVIWKNSLDSKVKVLKSSIDMLLSLFRIRFTSKILPNNLS